jgi:hypothetical protein
MLRIFLLAGTIMLTATAARGDSEIVIAIRYLQAKGTSHSHLYLYREDGKLLRQLTNDNSGQDSDPIFSGDGGTIVFTREKDQREFWSSDPLGKKLKKLTTAPDWYSAAKNSPAFTSSEEEESPESTPASPPEQSASPSARFEGTQEGQHQSGTALDAVVDARDRTPATITAPDGSGEIFWRKGDDKEDPLDWIMWFRDLKSGQKIQIGKLPGFPSFEPLQIRGKDSQPSRREPSDVDGQHESVGGREQANQFLFEGPLRLLFFSCHLDSTNGTTVEAFDFNKRKLIRLSPNYATPIPLPGEAAFLTLTENRYVDIPDSSKTANCSYIELWGADIKETCYDQSESPYCGGEPKARYAHKGSAAICYGASMYRPGKNPAVIIIRNGPD